MRNRLKIRLPEITETHLEIITLAAVYTAVLAAAILIISMADAVSRAALR